MASHNPIDQQPNQPNGQPSSSPLQRRHVPPHYVLDETDLMYAEETAADRNKTLATAEEEDPTEAEVPAPEPATEIVPPPVLHRPRREVHAPAWMRDFVS